MDNVKILAKMDYLLITFVPLVPKIAKIVNKINVNPASQIILFKIINV